MAGNIIDQPEQELQSESVKWHLVVRKETQSTLAILSMIRVTTWHRICRTCKYVRILWWVWSHLIGEGRMGADALVPGVDVVPDDVAYHVLQGLVEGLGARELAVRLVGGEAAGEPGAHASLPPASPGKGVKT